MSVLVRAIGVLALGTALFSHASIAHAEHAARDPSSTVTEDDRDAVIGATRVVTLPNGLRVIISPQRDTSRVAVLMQYDVGFRDQPAGYAGLPHLVEHLMFAGSRHVPRGTLAATLERAGATDMNGTTTIDTTNYFETLPAEQLPLALWIESDRMAFMPDVLDGATLENARRTVRNEFNERFEVVGGFAPRLLYQSIFPVDHPYHSYLDDIDDIGAISLRDVQWFWQRYYGPEHATLVIAGNVDVESALTTIRRYFEPIHARGVRRERQPVSLPVVDHTRRLSLEVPARRGPIRVSWITPRFLEADDAALDVLALALTNAPHIGLDALLVSEGSMALFAAAGQASADLASVFTVLVRPRPGSLIATILPRLEEALDTARAGRLPAPAIREASARFVTTARLGWNDPAVRAEAMARYERLRGTPDWIEQDIARYMHVDAQAVQRVAQTWLSRDREIVMTIVPDVRAPLRGRLGARTNSSEQVSM